MVDIIIPAYNCAKTLPRALGSIVAQTHPELCKVTVVDDCSTQNIKKIVNDFKVYLNIQYIRNEKNLKFPGLVRQVGLDNTNYPIVMFLDSDDMMAPRAVEIAQSEMTRTKADILLGAFYRQNEDGSWALLGENDTTWLHGNIYNRSFLEKNTITFPSGYNEDGSFNTQCYMLMENGGYIKEPLYYWMHNVASLTRREGNFSYKYGGDVITTLIHAYVNIFNHGGRNPKVYNNLGNHVALFHKLANDLFLIEESDEVKAELKNNIINSSADLFQKINLNKDDELIGWFKKGFANGFVKYVKDEMFIEPEDFFKECGLDISFTIADFNRLGEAPGAQQ